MANAPFWQLALLQTIGPAITVRFGTWAISRITTRAQRRREEQQLRHDLIAEMAETASSLYLATQRYWRARDRENLTGKPLHAVRTWLDGQYHQKGAEVRLWKRGSKSSLMAVNRGSTADGPPIGITQGVRRREPGADNGVQRIWA